LAVVNIALTCFEQQSATHESRMSTVISIMTTKEVRYAVIVQSHNGEGMTRL
jgi:hypothetical protein